jgi:threonine/homoserine/homoserine lactone efflux protein
MELDQWLSLAMICLAGAVSPGPSLLVILDATRRGGRPAGMLAAIGHGLGIFIYAFGAATGLGWLAGLGPVFLLPALQAAASLFLLSIAWRLWRAAGAAQPDSAKHSLHGQETIHMDLWRGFVAGLMIALFNPKVAVFFAALFSGLVQSGQTGLTHLAIAGLAGGIDVTVYLVYAWLAGSGVMHRWITGQRGTFDRVLALLFTGFALAIALDAVQTLL